MKFANGRQVLNKALRNGYAVGAFNFQDMEILQAIIHAANKEKSPVIIQTSEGAIEYAELNYLTKLATAALEESKVPVVLHLDHGKKFSTITSCIRKGYSSIMIDGSEHGLEKNIRITSKVVKYAHRREVSVEGELGRLQGVEDFISIKDKDAILTNPEAAKDFVDETGVDYLAVAIGTSHGPYKFKGKSRLDFERLRKIHKLVKIPLVLHGASSLFNDAINYAKRYGAMLQGARGVSDKDHKKAIKNGVAKINIDTDLRVAFIGAARKALKDRKLLDIRKEMQPVRDAVEKMVRRQMKIFGSSRKA